MSKEKDWIILNIIINLFEVDVKVLLCECVIFNFQMFLKEKKACFSHF